MLENMATIFECVGPNISTYVEYTKHCDEQCHKTFRFIRTEVSRTCVQVIRAECLYVET